MSQVIFDSTHEGRRVSIMAGWDHPLQYFFLTVFNLDADEDTESDILWGTLGHPDPRDKEGTERIREQLKIMNLEPPKGFWDLLHRQERNVIHVYEEGVWKKVQ